MRSFSTKRFLLVGFFLVILVGLVAIGFYFYLAEQEKSQEKKYESQVKLIWQGLSKKSTELKKDIDKTDSLDDLDRLSTKLSQLESFSRDKLYQAVSLQTPAKYSNSQSSLKAAIDSYSDYLSLASKLSLLYSKNKKEEKDLKELRALSEKTERKFRDFVKKTKFIKDKFPRTVFKLDRKIKLIVEKSRHGNATNLLAEAQAEAERIVKERRSKEAKEVLDVATVWLDAEKAGGTDTNWDLASIRFKQSILESFPPEARGKENYLNLFREGEAHAQLISYEVTGIFILSPTEALVSMRAIRQDIEGNKWPLETEDLPLVSENDSWLVDGVNF